MWDWPIPAGLDKALEEAEDVEMGEEEEEEDREEKPKEWKPGVPYLTKDSPSWKWKNNRCALAAKSENNKAGKKWGKGTTSQKRAAKRLVEQPHKNKDYWGEEAVQSSSSSSNPWQRDEGWWEDGWWSDPWKRDDSWWDDPWEREEDNPWEREGGGATSRRPRRRSAGSQGSQGSVSQTGEGSGRSSQRKKLMWRKKELEVEKGLAGYT